MLNFFDPECVPCIQEHPELVQFSKDQESLGIEGAELYSVITRGEKEEIDAFFAEEGGDWPAIYSEFDEFPVAFGVACGARDLDHRSEWCGAAAADLEGDGGPAQPDPAAVPGAVRRMTSDLNRKLKRWPGWVLLVFVIAGFLAVGATRATGPESQEDRIDAIARRVACPICDGESVFESQNTASQAIRNQVGELVAENELSDTEIIAFIETRYGAQVLLVPKATGFDSLVWVLPAVAFICGHGSARGRVPPVEARSG